MRRIDLDKSDRRFMMLIKMCMTSMTCIGVLFGYYSSNWLGAFIAFVWLSFLFSAATVGLQGVQFQRRWRSDLSCSSNASEKKATRV